MLFIVAGLYRKKIFETKCTFVHQIPIYDSQIKIVVVEKKQF